MTIPYLQLVKSLARCAETVANLEVVTPFLCNDIHPTYFLLKEQRFPVAS
jgi:hypothetical protein